MIALLLDHLWQSTLFALVAGGLTLLFRRNGASVRYGLWFAASMKFLIPFALLTALGGLFYAPVTPASWSPLLLALQPAATPFSAATPLLAAPAANGMASGPVVLDSILLALWALGFAAIAMLWLVRGARLRAGLRAATDLPLAAPLPVKSAAAQLEPGLVGLWRPVLVMPEGIAARLSPDEMRSVLAHELCHLRRRDNLTAALHMVVEALFWFHPLVWWLGARLIDERERACDESVLELGNDPETYAQGILKVCQFYLHSPLACAAGVSGADLKRRVEAIMENRFARRLGNAKKALLAAAALVAVAAPLALGLINSPLSLAPAMAQAEPSADEIAIKRTEQSLPRKPIAFDPAQFDKFAGTYQLMPQIVATVRRDGGHYFFRLTGQVDVEFFPESGTKFFAVVVPAQISFESDSQGHVTRLVVHQNGMEMPAPRIDESQAKSIEAALAARIKSNTPSPGTEGSLRRYIASLEQGAPNYDDMMPILAAQVRLQLPVLEQYIKKWGALKSITFKSVNIAGADIYDVVFEHGHAEWLVAPLTADGKVQGRGFQELP